VTPNQFRRLALRMTDAVEGEHMGHPDFRANGRIFATIAPDGKRGMVTLTPEEQADMMRDHPAIFEPAAGAWGRGGSTMVLLSAADEEAVGEAMTMAWNRTLKLKSQKRKVKTRKR
jgi:YjbR protein